MGLTGNGNIAVTLFLLHQGLPERNSDCVHHAHSTSLTEGLQWMYIC